MPEHARCEHVPALRDVTVAAFSPKPAPAQVGWLQQQDPIRRPGGPASRQKSLRRKPYSHPKEHLRLGVPIRARTHDSHDPQWLPQAMPRAPQEPEAHRWRLVLTLILSSEPEPEVVLVARDTDGDRSRLAGLRQVAEFLTALDPDRAIVLAAPHRGTVERRESHQSIAPRRKSFGAGTAREPRH